MLTSAFKTFKYLLVLSLLFCFKTSIAQVKYDKITSKIDSLANIGLPKSALKLVDQLDDLARKNNNAPQQVRAVIYRMTFQSYLEEDALQAIITRLKTDIDQAAYPVKPVLQSLLAQMYWTYYQQNRYQFSQRSKLQRADTAFTNWDLQTIMNETSRLYSLSLYDTGKEQNTPVGVLNGVLEGDSTTRYLRPTLYDLLVQRAFDFFLSDEPALPKPKLPFSLSDPRFFSDSRTFANLGVKTTDTASTYFKGIKFLQQATLFHLQKKDEEALADIDLQRLKFLYGKSNAEHKDSLYLNALNQIALNFSAKPISAEALVLEGQYYQGPNSLTIAYGFYKKAVTTYPASLGGKNSATLIKQIEVKNLSATVEDVNVPDKPVLALLEYKNLQAAKIAVYRLSASQLTDYNTVYGKDYSDFAQSKHKLEILKRLNPVQTKALSWKNTGDYRKHSFEFKIDALIPGNYVLLVKDAATNDETLTGLNYFKISGLAYTTRVNPDGRLEVRVMDRETGRPLSNVKINLSGRTYNYNNSTNKNEWIDINENGSSDKNGLFYSGKFTAGNNAAVNLAIKGDTLNDRSKYIYGARDNSDDDYSVDKTVLFTDRQIYRPGQTIYFKGLELELYKGKSKIRPAQNTEVDFLDANGKQVSNLKLKTNDFGTFSGSFIIPQTMLNGNVQLKTENGDIYVKVEEYKRPTFQVEFLPLKESYKLNDSVTIKGTVTAFSGYGLSQAKVAYHITRQAIPLYFDEYRYRNIGSVWGRPAEVESDTITADDQGKFQIKFKAIPGDSKENDNINYTYAINADATDESAETQSAQTAVTVGNNDIKINDELPEQLFAKDTVSLPVSIGNLNGQSQKGEIKVEVYALKNTDRVFKNRLWSNPDQFIINGSDFKNDFPGYAYKNEDVVTQWPKLNKVEDLSIKVEEDKPGTINLDELRKQPSGMYQVVISARNEKGDTTSLTKYVNLINNQAKPAKFDDWVIPVLTTVKPGGNAEFLVGIDQKINVLLERYNEAKLISSQWITIEKGQQSIKMPVTDSDKDVAVQFMMIYQNRMYSSYQKITILNPKQDLKIKFLTFRDKLQPGEKEQWKLQVTGENNEKQAAEMVADLYDASLDDITPAQSWKDALNVGEKYQPNYFVWINEGFLNDVSTYPVNYLQNNYSLLTRKYEALNLFGYDYYGGYNNAYNQYLEQVEYNSKLAEQITKGYDITGKVIDKEDGSPIPGVSVIIKGTKIGTQTNIAGYFKIRVPVNATLTFSYIGYKRKEVSTKKATNLTVKLIASSNSLNEVVVTGYSSQAKMDIYGASAGVTVNEAVGSADAKAAPMASMGVMRELKVNGKEFRSDNTVFLRGTNLPNDDIKPISLRTNFNETAFFYPQLQTNEKGEILIDFTIPEALTRWKFMGFAHTKGLQSGYIENTVITQKQLSISANTPRFLREGDTITISARLANLADKRLKGKVQMQLLNALNMQPISLFIDKADADQKFEIAGGTTKAVSFRMVIPAGLDALTYRLTADAGQFTDGEENTLPVLPNRMLVTESMPMMVRAGQTRDFTFDKLVNQSSNTLKNKTLTLEYTQNPAWYAVQALPYMMEFPYECSEQVFSRYFANSLAENIVTKMPAIKQVFDQWKNSNSPELLSNLEKNQELKSTLIEETPWLQDAMSETEQKKRIALLFDLNKMSDELKLNIDKLQKKQLPDGGFPWFGGDQSDRYITQDVLAGIGELYHVGAADLSNTVLKDVADNAMAYLDNALTDVASAEKRQGTYEKRVLSPLEIHSYFTQSYFTARDMSPQMQALLANYLGLVEKQWVNRSAYEQGMIALTMQRNKRPEVAAAIIKSLLETAQQSDDMGMYWAKNQQGYFWYESPVETQSLLIELFTEAGGNDKAVDEMKIWLLRNKQTSDWKTTKATAAACYALLLKGSNPLADTSRSIIELDGKPLEELKPDIKADAGTGYIKTSWVDEQIKPGLGKVEIKNSGTNISWGALHWQYLENLDKITASQANIHLERKYFIQKQTDAGPVLTAVDATHQPKTGDLLKVVVHLEADRDFEYVQLKDMRPAGTEPVDALSTYKYQDGLYYYQVTKDVATNFFISYLNKGNYVFDYQLRVAQPGNFSTGITSIQCMYAPEFNAHSQGERLTILP